MLRPVMIARLPAVERIHLILEVVLLVINGIAIVVPLFLLVDLLFAVDHV